MIRGANGAPILSLMATVLLLIVTALLLYIAWQDFLTLKIRNPHVIALGALALAYAAASGLDALPSALLAGAVLFVMAFVFWLLGLVGAGDAKLYFPVGVLIGLEGFVPYLLILLASSLLFVLLFRLGNVALGGRGLVGARLQEISERRSVPYSMPMVVATIGAMAILGKYSL